jgi:hypothetical protein
MTRRTVKRRNNPANNTSQKWQCGVCQSMNRKTHSKCAICELRAALKATMGL